MGVDDVHFIVAIKFLVDFPVKMLKVSTNLQITFLISAYLIFHQG